MPILHYFYHKLKKSEPYHKTKALIVLTAERSNKTSYYVFSCCSRRVIRLFKQPILPDAIQIQNDPNNYFKGLNYKLVLIQFCVVHFHVYPNFALQPSIIKCLQLILIFYSGVLTDQYLNLSSRIFITDFRPLLAR